MEPRKPSVRAQANRLMSRVSIAATRPARVRRVSHSTTGANFKATRSSAAAASPRPVLPYHRSPVSVLRARDPVRAVTVTALKTPQDHTLLDALPPGLGLATTAGSAIGKPGQAGPGTRHGRPTTLCELRRVFDRLPAGTGPGGFENLYSADCSNSLQDCRGGPAVVLLDGTRGGPAHEVQRACPSP